MIIKRDTMTSETRDRMRGGSGSVSITNLVPPETLKNARLLAEVVIPPDSGIGEHPHNEETEYYIILSGEGIVCDNGIDMIVKAGDVVDTGSGSTHSIRNSGKEDLRLIAVIITY